MKYVFSDDNPHILHISEFQLPNDEDIKIMNIRIYQQDEEGQDIDGGKHQWDARACWGSSQRIIGCGQDKYN